MAHRVLIATLCVGAILWSPQATAQVGSLHSPRELLQMANVAVIADCGRTRDKGRVERRPGDPDAFPWIESETVFVVRELLKAADPDAVRVGGSLRLRHYRPDLERWQRHHPPASGTPPAAVLGLGEPLSLEEGLSYVLFLRRVSDHLYDPVDGHTFPARSVHRFLPGDRP